MSTTPMKGKADYLALGDWNVACAECGRKFKASEMRQLPPGVPGGGMWVCLQHWNQRQPQDYVRGVPDRMAAPYVQQQVQTYPLEIENVTADDALLEIAVDTVAAAAGSEPLIINVAENVTVTSIVITDVSGGAAAGTAVAAASIVLNNFGVVEAITNADAVPLTLQGNGATAGIAARLAFTVQPTDTDTDATISPSPQVTVRDCFGTTVATYTEDVEISIASGAGTLSGTLIQAAVAGVATFNNLALDTADTYSLFAESTTITNPITTLTTTSTTFEVEDTNIITVVEVSPGLFKYDSSTPYGSLVPDTYLGSFIPEIVSQPGSSVFYLQINAVFPGQSYFTSVTINGVQFLSASASVFDESSGTFGYWQWTDGRTIYPSAGTYSIIFA